MTQDAKTLNEDALTKAIWKFQERTGGFGPDDDANIVTDIIKSYLAALTRNAEPMVASIGVDELAIALNAHYDDNDDWTTIARKVLSALSATPPVAQTGTVGITDALRKARDFIDDEREHDPDNAHQNDRDRFRERNALRPKLIAELDAALSAPTVEGEGL